MGNMTPNDTCVSFVLHVYEYNGYIPESEDSDELLLTLFLLALAEDEEEDGL